MRKSRCSIALGLALICIWTSASLAEQGHTNASLLKWTAVVQSTPPGAEVFCVSETENRIPLGKTPLTVDVQTQEVKGQPGTAGTFEIVYKLPMRRFEDGFYCVFEVVMGTRSITTSAFYYDPLPKDAQGGLAFSLRQGKYILMKGRFTQPYSIPSDFKMDDSVSKTVSVSFTSPKLPEKKEKDRKSKTSEKK
jgi:hypothetical protein